MTDYKVWHVQNPPTKGRRYTVKTPQEGAMLINQLAHQDLQNESIECNAFGMEYWDEAHLGWFEWYDDEGNDVCDLADQLEEVRYAEEGVSTDTGK